MGLPKKSSIRTQAPHKRTYREVTRIPIDVLNRAFHDMRNRSLECFSRDGEHLKDVIFRS